MTADMSTSIRASRIRVPRTRGAASGVLLIVLGLWAGLVPFIGPYLNVAYTPAPDKAWHWTAARGVLEVLPGGVAVLGGLILLLSRSRLVTSFGGWLAALGGLWLVVGPSFTEVLNIDLGVPDPSSRDGVRALATLVFFYGIGAAILLVAALALGRLSVHSVRDVRAAERRAAAEEAAEAEEQRRIEERVAEERAAQDRAAAPPYPANEAAHSAPGGGFAPTGGGPPRHGRPADGSADPNLTRPQQAFTPAPPPPGPQPSYSPPPGAPPTYTPAPPPPEPR